MVNNRWEYGGAYKKYDMTGIIEVGLGKLKVHDIFDNLPEFMKEADCIFVDPPCSKGNLNSFYTKADSVEYKESYEPFKSRLFCCIDEINPDNLFIEVFKSNKDDFVREVEKRYKYVRIFHSYYYHNKKNKCWIIQGTREKSKLLSIDNLDEEDFIKYVCKNVEYSCIGDLCMGRGLVGYNSFLNNKKFVGTELNEKRLAVLVDKICKFYE